MKKLIWFIGGMASGKSTMRRLLTSVLATEKGKLIQEEGLEITSFGRVGIVGQAKEGGVCDGLDTSFGRLGKEGALNSVERAVKNYPITILEGSQTSSKWTEELVNICNKYGCEFYLVIMDITLWENYNRLLKRILERGGSEADVTNKRLDSVRSKYNQFEGVFIKAEQYGNIIRYRLNTSKKTDEEKVIEILKLLKLY